jgi:flagellar hook-associated protein FlgK
MGGNMAEQNETRTAKLADLLRGQNVTEAQDILSSLKTNPQEALMKSVGARGQFGQAFAPQLVSNMFKEEIPMILPENATAINRKGEVIATGKAKEEKPPVSYQEYQLAKKEGFTGSYNDYQTLDANRKAPKINVGVGGGEISGGGTNNNGIPVGKFDKMGRYISPKGEVYPASAVTEARKEHDAATDLAFKLNQLSESDIKNAYGSLTDYTTSRVGRMAGSTKTVDAQTKINNLQINSVLNNLSQLKGASSDKEMAQMIKDFPGYEAPPSVMNNWVNRAATATNRFLKRSENRFGFDTEYANPSIKSTTKDDAGDFTIKRKQ